MRGLAPYRLLLLQPRAMAATVSNCSFRTAISIAQELHATRFLLPVSLDGSRFTSNLFCSSASSAVYTETTTQKSRPQPVRSAAVASQQSSKKAKSRLPSSKSSSSVCPGCGINMQDKNPDAPGFFITPRRELDGGAEEIIQGLKHTGAVVIEEDDMEEDETESEGEDDISDDEKEHGLTKEGGWTWVQLDPNDTTLSDLDGKFDEHAIESEFRKDSEMAKRLDGFRSAGPQFGSGKDAGHSLKSGKMKGKGKKGEAEKVLVCARCHQLRYYGKVSDQSKENLLPDFDFEHTVGARLLRTHATRTVVVMVVDSVDFDGSFPRRAASLITNVIEKEGASWKENKSGNLPRLILVANKIDLLPKQISPTRLEHWIRRRAKDGGAPHLSGLFLVSCVKNWGVKSVLECIKDMAGPRGEVWVVGAQNAGKSSLINALAKVEEGAPLTQLTEAPIPGTTLGLVRLGGILPAKAKLFDTPGLLHPHQITVRLNREEQKIVQARKELRPRTYRVKAGDTIHVGGLVRVDVKDISASSMYITVWGSTFLNCHFTKTSKADDVFEKHVGVKLQPPVSKERLEELGPWLQTPMTITGDNWEKNSIDIAIAGLGWFALGLKGTADLDIWTYEGVGITTRSALVPDMARYFEKAGFTILKSGASS